MSKVILILVYILLIATSGYNLYSYKPDIGLGIKLSKGMSDNLQNYIVISNISEDTIKNLDIIVNNIYYLHIYEIEGNNNYNAFSAEFLKIGIRPNNSSRIIIKNEDKVIKRLEEVNKIFGKKISVSIFGMGVSHNQKL